MKSTRASGSDRTDERERADGRGGRSGLPLVRSVRRGARGGFIATVVMTIYRAPVFRALPPTAEFWAKYLGSEGAEQYPLQGIVVHFLYGAVGGGVFGPLFWVVDRRTGLARETVGVATGFVYGVVLSLFGSAVVFRHVLDRELEPEHELVFHVGHVVYGLTLGTWVSSREAFGEVYDEARSTES